MKMTIVLQLASLVFGTNAVADFKLSQSPKAIVCYANDNQSLDLNAKKTTLQYTVEGETKGAQKIVDVKTDGKTFITYSTNEISLTLSNDGDTFLYDGDQDPSEVRCKFN